MTTAMIDRCGIKDGINIDAAKHCNLAFLVLGIVTLWQELTISTTVRKLKGACSISKMV
jgi:hypothetical protein